jgi:L-serine kinase (ATP) / ParB family transcriptional regulator, heme-responsive regulator
MINYTVNFFDLELIKISEIRLHETTESNRLRNIFDRISKSKYLMNPVIVGRYKKEYILIDGANRLSTLKEIGCKLAVAQVIDYMDTKIKLKRWNHLIYEFGIEDIVGFCIENNFYFSRKSFSSAIVAQNENRNCVIATDINKNETILIRLSDNFGKMVSQLNSITKFYFGKYDFDRSEEEIRIRDLMHNTRKKGTLIQFPRFTKQQIFKLTKNNLKVPAGITRHILNNRVLHVRFELSRLMDDKDIKGKKSDLDRYLNNKIDNNKVRQYKESVIVFDE